MCVVEEGCVCAYVKSSVYEFLYPVCVVNLAIYVSCHISIKFFPHIISFVKISYLKEQQILQI